MVQSFTRADVAKHDQFDDAWIIVDDGVYNVSEWAYKHPGGRVILYYRGQDATEPVKAFHPDMERTNKYMKPYFVGNLTPEEHNKMPQVIADFRALREEFEAEGNSPFDHLSQVYSPLFKGLLNQKYPSTWRI